RHGRDRHRLWISTKCFSELLLALPEFVERLFALSGVAEVNRQPMRRGIDAGIDPAADNRGERFEVHRLVGPQRSYAHLMCVSANALGEYFEKTSAQQIFALNLPQFFSFS